MLIAVCALGGWGVYAKWHRLRTPFGAPTPPARPAVVKPADMPGLGYLPESTEAVIAVQVPQLLERLGPDASDKPQRALTALGLPESAAEMIDKASAVGLKNVDELVIGLTFENHVPPQIVVVVHARQPFDLDVIAKEAKARSLKKDGRTLYASKAGSATEVYWWKAADRVLVATILTGDFKGVPGLPRTGIDHLRPAVAALIRERLAVDSVAWFAASSDRWDRHLAPYTWLPGTPLQGRSDLLKPAEQLQNLTVSVPDDPENRVDVQIGLKSSARAAELRGAMSERFRGEPIEVSGDDETCRVQMTNDPSIIRSILGRLTAPGK